MNRPYPLLCLSALFWAGNIVVGRYSVGQLPPMAMSFLRWTGAFVILLPFAWRPLAQDWVTIRRHWMMMVLLSFIGVATFNTLGYWSLQYTQALNALLLQSSGPLYVALFSLILFGIRLTWTQTLGIVMSLTGVLTILLHGDLGALFSIQLNKGDVGYTIALILFGLYSALMARRRPQIQPISFLAFTCGCGALFVLPLFAWEMACGRVMPINPTTISVLLYLAIFPSALAYLFFNRGVELIGANRAAPFLHLIPVFGSVMAIGLLGERFRLFHVAGYALVLTGVIIAAHKPPLRTPD